jgi:hypothetical protein
MERRARSPEMEGGRSSFDDRAKPYAVIPKEAPRDACCEHESLRAD